MKIITSADVREWMTRYQGPGYLPALMYRLIKSSASALVELDFPAGEGVGLGGWDGEVIAAGNHPNLPDGRSVWEVSTRSDVRVKAEEDYAKRAGFPDASSTTYVAVTARSSTVIKTWAHEKRTEGRWLDVRGYDANRLSSWIDSLPAVARWFAGLIGKIPTDVLDLDTWWSEWSSITRPATTEGLVLAGLDSPQGPAATIAKWAVDPPAAITISAGTEDEAIAIAIAALRSDTAAAAKAATAWIVTSRDAWTQLVTSTEPLLLVAAFADRAGVPAAVSRGHHVLIPLDLGASSADVEVRTRSTDAVRQALNAMGLTSRESEERGEVGRLSLSALRRRLSIVAGVAQPKWATPAEAGALIGPFLAGRWDDTSPGDRDIVAKLAGVAYEDALQTVRRWAQEPDPPVRMAGQHFTFIDRFDAWALLHSRTGREHLERLSEAVLTVLGELDPKFDLPVEQQYAAAIYGKQLTYSASLREALAEVIALIAATSTSHPPAGRMSGQTWACLLVRELLHRTPSGRVWASLSRILPLLAEACPDEFESGLEAALEDPEFIPALFIEVGSSFTASSPHPGLLWALEVLAWSSDHLGSATDLLSRLVDLEPPGQRGNRPIGSLVEIYKLWYPSTSATLEQRAAALERLVEVNPGVAWSVLTSTLPQWMGVAHLTVRPRWRPWATEPSPTGSELAAGIAGNVELALRLAHGMAGRWVALVELLDDIREPQFSMVVTALRGDEIKNLSEVDRAQVWTKLREFVDKHREFKDARWALPNEYVDKVAEALDAWEPSDLVLRDGWLFSDWPTLPGRRDGDWAKQAQDVARLRAIALEAVLTLGGLDSLIAFASRLPSPWWVGITAATVLGQEMLVDLLHRTLDKDDHGLQTLGRGALQELKINRPDAVTDLLKEGVWTSSARADLYTALAFTEVTWEALNRDDHDVQRMYWVRANIFQPGPETPAALIGAVKGLVEHELYEKAVQLLAHHLDDAPTELIAAALVAMATTTRTEPFVLGSLVHELPRLLEKLHGTDVSEDVLADLEWTFLPIIQEPFHKPMALIGRLQHDPAFFVQILERLYRRRDEAPKPAAEVSLVDQAIFSRGVDLLWHWSDPPGCSSDGSIDAEALLQWVRDARALAANADRVGVADSHIGQILAHLPSPTPDEWPPDVLGQVLEDSRSPVLDNGLGTGLTNKRGIVTKAWREGGSQERKLAEQYAEAAARLASRYPRLARVLRRLARGYDDEATTEDYDADLSSTIS